MFEANFRSSQARNLGLHPLPPLARSQADHAESHERGRGRLRDDRCADAELPVLFQAGPGKSHATVPAKQKLVGGIVLHRVQPGEAIARRCRGEDPIGRPGLKKHRAKIERQQIEPEIRVGANSTVTEGRGSPGRPPSSAPNVIVRGPPPAVCPLRSLSAIVSSISSSWKTSPAARFGVVKDCSEGQGEHGGGGGRARPGKQRRGRGLPFAEHPGSHLPAASSGAAADAYRDVASTAETCQEDFLLRVDDPTLIGV